MSSAQRLQDHDEIREWAEDRGGIPTIVKGTGGLLRIDFVVGAKSGGRNPNLDETTWERWFEIFEESNLDFLCSPEPASRFFKLVERRGREEHAQP